MNFFLYFQEGIAFFAYDIAELNNYADYVNIMTYDYHFYSQVTPFTGRCERTQCPGTILSGCLIV